MDGKRFIHFLFAEVFATFEFSGNLLVQSKIRMAQTNRLRLICQVQKEGQSYIQQYWIAIQDQIPSNDGLIYFCWGA
jgi:hypothetical protein